MNILPFFLAAIGCLSAISGITSATEIREVLEPPNTPGNAFIGTFFVTPSEPIWAFGVGNDLIEDTSISGISFIDGLEANDHWVSSLISRTTWEAGYDFDSIRPIGATPPSSFSIDTSTVPWQWGDSEYVAFYWLSEAGADPSNPQAVLQQGTEYDAFKFFTSGPNSPFATFSGPTGGTITTGETIVGSTETIEAEIDIKPGSDVNPVNIKSNGKRNSQFAGGLLPVAILTTDDYDGAATDPETVTLGDPGLPGFAIPVKSTVEDVDGDGNDDLLLHFSVPELLDFMAIDEETLVLTLTAETEDGVSVEGMDFVTIRR